MFVHCVYFWLRNDLSDAERSQFNDGVSSLTSIETVRFGFVGRPAATNRPVIDRSYSTALVAVFEDEDAHDTYQAHPVHDAFRETCSGFWKDVRIYDFETGSVEGGRGAG